MTAPFTIVIRTEAGEELRRTLEAAGYAVHCQSLADSQRGNGPLPSPPQGRGEMSSVGMILVDGAHQPDRALQLCHYLRSEQHEQFIPILYITELADSAQRLASLQRGADTYLPRPFGPDELVAQVQALLRIKERHDHLSSKSAEMNRIHKRLQTAYQQIDMELDLAQRIQASFLPQSLPVLPEVRFAVKYRPNHRVGGDFYDVFRLDEHHLGFYVADAMGHGVPASLLTIFVKKGVRPKEINGNSYRLAPPPEVLQKLNRDLLDQAVSENPFITMVYGLFNCQTGVLQFSRAGHPHPLYLPREGPPRLWQLEGSLLGVFETQYRLQEHTLCPGDKLLFYTDGMDAAGFEQEAVGVPSLLAAARRFQTLPIEELVERLAFELFGQTRQTDDLTILGLEVLG
ncbi:MAG: SpoIIE family protein phosphatase [Gemmataceae bacterium]|nr:SpoIIE family protein phosphatase [Gemmataceae bacterium]MCI0742355.1 SpoIIE family protein phosphatase [Gemmataceae bacterium]